MADQEIPVSFTVDENGLTFPSRINRQITMSNPRRHMCVVLPDPNGAGDVSNVVGSFVIPPDYAGSPRLIFKGTLDGAPSSATIAFRVIQLARAAGEAKDTAFEAEDIASASSSDADEDQYEEEVTITPTATYSAGKVVDFEAGIDDNVHTYTGNFLLEHVIFLYSDS